MIAHVPAERLLALLRGDAPVCAPAEWDVIVDEAVRHKLASLLYARVRALPAAAAPPPASRDRLRDIYTRIALRNALLFRELRAVLELLEAHGIDAIALKGAALALDVYADPALRSMADLDVLVRRDVLAAAERILLEAGYGSGPRPDVDEFTALNHQLAKIASPAGTVIELHWTIERPTSPFDIDLDGLWERSRTCEVRGRRVRVPAPEDQLFHICLHAAYHHRFERAALKQLCDVAAVVERHGDAIDWALLARIGRDSGAAPFLRCTLRLAHDLLGAKIPAHAIDALPAPPHEQSILAAARNFILAPAEKLTAAHDQLVRTRSLAERVRIIGATLFPGRVVIASVHGLPARSPRWILHAALRPFDLLVRGGRIGARILFKSRSIRPALRRESDRRLIYRWVDEADAARTGIPAG